MTAPESPTPDLTAMIEVADDFMDRHMSGHRNSNSPYGHVCDTSCRRHALGMAIEAAGFGPVRAVEAERDELIRKYAALRLEHPVIAHIRAALATLVRHDDTKGGRG